MLSKLPLPSSQCIAKYSWCKERPGPRGKHQTTGEPSIEPLSNYCPKWRNSRTVEKTRFLALVHYTSHHSNPELSLNWAATVSCQRSVCQVPGRWHHSVCQCVLAEGDSVSEVGDLNGQSRQNWQWWGCKSSCSSGAGLCPTWPGTRQWRTSQCPQCPLCWREQQHNTSRGGRAWHSLLTLLTSSFQRRLGWLFHQLLFKRMKTANLLTLRNNLTRWTASSLIQTVETALTHFHWITHQITSRIKILRVYIGLRC